MENLQAQEFTLRPMPAPQDEVKATLSMHPHKFALWLFIVTVIMIFAAFTSAYIVKQADGGWDYFELPPIFGINTIIIVLSSITLHWAYLSAKRDNLQQNRIALLVTTAIGITFLVMQVIGWRELVYMGKFFTGGNASAAFVYVLTAVHGVHLVSAVIYLVVMVVKALGFKVHSKNMLNMEMSTTYWHFLGGLWVYLYLFLLLNN